MGKGLRVHLERTDSGYWALTLEGQKGRRRVLDITARRGIRVELREEA